MVTRFKTSKVHVNPFANVVDSSQPYLATLERELEFHAKAERYLSSPNWFSNNAYAAAVSSRTNTCP